MRRPVIIALVLVVAACGGEARPVFGDASPDPTAVRPADTSGSIVTSLGARPGFDATLLALDAGYTPAQLAADPDGLDRDGVIAGTLPDGESLGLIHGSIDAIRRSVRLASPPGTAHSLDDAWEAAEDRIGALSVIRDVGVPLGLDRDVPATMEGTDGARALLGVVLALMDVGYSFDQALNGYLFGEWVVAITGPFSGCIVLLDRDGSVVRPTIEGAFGFDGSQACRDVFTDDVVATDDPASGDGDPSVVSGDPVVYEGRNMWADSIDVDFPDGTDRDVLWPVDIVLELYPDGVALITLEFDDLQFQFDCAQSYVRLAPATESSLVLAEGTHTDGRFEFPEIGLNGVTGVSQAGVAYANSEWHRTETSNACGPIAITRHLFFSIERVG